MSTVTLTLNIAIQYVSGHFGLKIATQPFCMTLRLIMMPNDTKFGYKTLSGSKDVFRIKPDR